MNISLKYLKTTCCRTLSFALAIVLLFSLFSVLIPDIVSADEADEPVTTVTSNETDESAEEKLEKAADVYAGKTIGVQLGTIFDETVAEYFPESNVGYYNSNADLALALDAGKVDAYITDEPFARLLCQTYTDQYIDVVIAQSPYAYIFPKDSARAKIIREELNEYLAKIKQDGTLNEIDSVWFGSDEDKKVVDVSLLTGERGTLEMSTVTAVGAPFTYVKEGKYVGYDIDVLFHFCMEYGYKLNITDYNASGIFASVSSGIADIGASCICVTEERMEEMDFSDTNYEGSIVLVTKNSSSENKEIADRSGFFDSLKDSLYKTFVKENRWKLFLGGMGITLLITVLSAFCGSIIGFAIFLIYRKKKRFINIIIEKISDVLQMTPVVVVLMIFYYLILAETGLSGIAVCVIAFSLMFACSVNNLFITAVNTVDEGQSMAVRALGYKDTKGFLRIILPQAIPNFVPGYKGEIVGMIKSTSIVSYVAVQDLTMVAEIVRSSTYDAFFPLVVSAVVYYLFARLLTCVVDAVNVKTDPCSRKKEQILKGVKTK